MSKRLLVTDGKRERELVLLERIVVGRDPTCDVSHDDALLSRRHAEFIAGTDTVMVRDLGSRNGIYINGVRAAEQSLRPGDVVQIGPLKVRYAHDGVPLSILPEQLITDETSVIPVPKAAASPPAPVARVASVEADSSEQTRILPPLPRAEAVRSETQRPATPPPTPRIEPLVDHDATQFVAPPRASGGARATAPRPPSPVSPPQPRPAAARPQPALAAPPQTSVAARVVERTTPEAAVRTYVFVQLFLLAGVVLLSAMVPLVMWRVELLAGTAQPAASFPLLWLALPLGVAIIATYYVGNLINRRVVDAVHGATANSTGFPRP